MCINLKFASKILTSMKDEGCIVRAGIILSAVIIIMFLLFRKFESEIQVFIKELFN